MDLHKIKSNAMLLYITFFHIYTDYESRFNNKFVAGAQSPCLNTENHEKNYSLYYLALRYFTLSTISGLIAKVPSQTSGSSAAPAPR